MTPQEQEQILDYLDKMTLFGSDKRRFDKAFNWVDINVPELFEPEFSHNCKSLIAINALKFGKVYEVAL
jgi:hypothetical protein